MPRRFTGGREDLRKSVRKGEQTRLLTPEHLRCVYIQTNQSQPLALGCPYREAAHNLNANWSFPRIDAHPPRIVQQRESNCRYDQIIRPEFLRSLRLWLRRCFQGSSQCRWWCFRKAFHTKMSGDIASCVFCFVFWSPSLLYYFEKLLYRFKKEGISVIFFIHMLRMFFFQPGKKMVITF